MCQKGRLRELAMGTINLTYMSESDMHPDRQKLLGFLGNDTPEACGFENGILTRILPSPEWAGEDKIWDGRLIYDWATQVLSVDDPGYATFEDRVRLRTSSPQDGLTLLRGHVEQLAFEAPGHTGGLTWIFRAGSMIGYYKPRNLKRLRAEDLRYTDADSPLTPDYPDGPAYLQAFHPITNRPVWVGHPYGSWKSYIEADRGVPVILHYALRMINAHMSQIFETDELDRDEEYQQQLTAHGVTCWSQLPPEKPTEYPNNLKYFWLRVVAPRLQSELNVCRGPSKTSIEYLQQLAVEHVFWAKSLQTITPKAVLDYYALVKVLPTEYNSIYARVEKYSEMIKLFRDVVFGTVITKNA